MKKISILFLFFVNVFCAHGFSQEVCNCPTQNKIGKGTIYFGFGYNLDKFSKSTIYFKNSAGDNYDFTLTDLKAIDRDGIDHLFSEDLTIPQFSFRIGYYFNNKKDLGIEINYDHVKYVVVQNQPTHVTGTIRGKSYDKDTIMTPDFVMYEHTNGANYCMLDLIKRHTFLKSSNKKHWLSYVLKPGLGFVFPRSDTKLFGNRINDQYHVAGIVAGIDGGLRYDFFKHFYLETSLKGAYANYMNVRLSGNGKAHQHFFSLEYIAILGLQFGL
jgi:hypothetical protein